MSRVSDVWQRDHPWAPLYDFVVERSRLGPVLWRAFMGSDLNKLYAAAREIGEVPDGGAILDIPCGGGVALRGLRPGQRVRYVAADISEAMLERTRAEAAQRGLGQVETLAADVGALPFADGEFDLGVAFTSLHCFPDPALAVSELGRVLKPGGRLTGSAFLNDTGVRYEPMRAMGRASGLLGPSGSTADLRRWFAEGGFEDVHLDASGAIVYFRARRPG